MKKVFKAISGNKNKILKASYGAVVAQLLPIISFPLLAKYYTPIDFGNFAIYMGIFSISTSVSTLRLDFAIVISRTKLGSLKLLYTSVIISVFITGFLIVLLWVLSILFHVKFPCSPFIIGSSIFFMSIYNSFLYWFNRNGHFQYMSLLKFLLGSIHILLSLYFGMMGVNKGMLFAHSLSLILAILFVVPLLRKEISYFIKHKGNLGIWDVLNSHISYIKSATPAAFFNIVSFNIPNLFIGSFFQLNEAGIFSSAYRFVFTPSSFLAVSLGDLLRNNISKQINAGLGYDGLYKSVLLTVGAGLLILGISALLFFNYILINFIPLEWKNIIFCINILSLVGYLKFLFTLVENSYLLNGNNSYALIWSISRLFTLMLLCGVVYVIDFNFQTFIVLFSVLSSGFYIIDILFGYIISKKSSL